MKKSSWEERLSGRVRTRATAAGGQGFEKPRGRIPIPLIALLVALTLATAGGAWWLHLRRSGASAAAPDEAMEPAERTVRERAARAPRDVDAQLAFGAFLLEHGRPYEAIWSFQDALELWPKGEARRGLAQALIAAGLPRLALPTLGEGADANPIKETQWGGDIEERRVAAAAYLAMGDALGAVAVLRAASSSLDADALLALGNAYAALGDDGNAATFYQQHIRVAPNSTEGHIAYGRLASRLGHWREALTSLQRATQLAPGEPQPLFELGLALQARGGPAADSVRAGGAIYQFQRTLASNPDYGPAHLQIGLWHLRHRRPALAAASLQRAVATGVGGDTRLQWAAALDAAGQKAAACYQRGRYFMAAQQPHLAIREFERMATLPPKRPDAFLMLCSAYAKMNENGRAAEVARRGLEQFPDDQDLLARRAMLLIMADNRVAGAELCRHWLQKRPDAAEPYRLLGSIARTELRHAEAVRLCEQAMERDPQNAEYCRETARALMGDPTTENQSRAAEVLRRAIRLDLRNGEARLQLADVLLRLGELEAAREQYLRGMDRSPADRRGVVGLSQLCPRLGKPARMGFFGGIVRTLHDREDAARGLWRRVFLDPNDADAHARLAALLLEAADLDQARYQLTQTVALRPNRTNAKFQLQVLERLLAQQER